MGVSATGTLRGVAVPLPRKFMNFSSQNGMIWCILGVLFSRFMCPVDFSFTINFIEVLLKGKNKTLVKILGGIVNTGRPLRVKYWGGGRDHCNPCGVDAYVYRFTRRLKPRPRATIQASRFESHELN